MGSRHFKRPLVEGNNYSLKQFLEPIYICFILRLEDGEGAVRQRQKRTDTDK
jgi:hypothetical protein